MPTTKPNFFDAQVPGVAFQSWGPQGWSGDTYATGGPGYFVVEPEIEKYLRSQGYAGSLTGSNYQPQQMDRRDAADRGMTLQQAQQEEAGKAWTRSPELDQFMADRGWALQSGQYQQPGERQSINLQRLVGADGNALAVNEFNDRTTFMEKASRAATGALLLYTGAGLAGLTGAPAAGGGGGAAGGGGLLSAEAAVPTLGTGSITGGSGLSAAQMAALQTPFQMTAPLTLGELGVAGAGGAAAAGGAGGGGAGGGLLSGSGAGGATAGGSNVWNPAIIDSAMNTAGYGANAQAATNLGTSLYSTGAQGGGLWDTISNGASNWISDPNNWLKLAGAAAGAADAKDQTQTQTRDPWGPAQPYILEALQQGQKLNQQYQAQPFSPQQQAAYNNLGGLLNLANTNAPGLLSGFQANATGANNYDRSNPRKALLGSAPMQGAWNPGLLSFFPQNGGGG